jgi:hypothetical protein
LRACDILARSGEHLEQHVAGDGQFRLRRTRVRRQLGEQPRRQRLFDALEILFPVHPRERQRERAMRTRLRVRRTRRKGRREPAGSVTTAFFKSALAKPDGSSFCGTRRPNERRSSRSTFSTA